MDFEWNDDQRAILEAVEQLLAQYAGPARAIELQQKDAYDDALDRALADAGFRDVLQGDDTGPLEAALVTEAVARAGGVVAIGAAALVAPATSGRVLPGPVALATADQRGPCRFGAQARTLLVLDEASGEARAVALEPGAAPAVRSNYGYPLGDVSEALARPGESFGRHSAVRMRRWWRLALAAEAVGAMQAALDVTTGYVKERRQFGRAIGSFQAVQHRLAECAILIEGSRWLLYEAAFRDAPDEATAAAAAHAVVACEQVFAETHQLSGAIGYTREHDLHVFSMRLQALRQELGGATAHCRGLARARWGAAAR